MILSLSKWLFQVDEIASKNAHVVFGNRIKSLECKRNWKIFKDTLTVRTQNGAMLKYFMNRVFESCIVLAVMSLVVYFLIGLMPGDPIDLMVSGDPNLTAEDAQRLRALYGLDQPLWSRYLAWATQALTGEFGWSRLFNQPVLDIVIDRLGNTLWLMGISFVLSIVIALPLGVMAAVNPGGWRDSAINLLSFAGISLPPFWLALLLIMVFAAILQWLPAGGMAEEGASFGTHLRHLILPVLALTLASVGHHIRFIRAAMIEVLRQDFIRTARAKGATTSRVIWRHALRNALIPVVTILALKFGALVSGALITETMFQYRGMGVMIFDAIQGNDFNLALVGLLFATLLTLASNFLADVAYAVLDPRISFAKEKMP